MMNNSAKFRLMMELEDRTNKSDFHIHSNFSGDGEHSVDEIMELLVKENVLRAAITDHDSMEGSELAAKAAGSFPVEMISGVELTTRYDNQFIHILGYGFPLPLDAKSPLAIELKKISRKRYENISRIISKMKSAGIHIEEEDIRRKCGGRAPMITAYSVAALNDQRNSDLEIFRPYRPGGAKCHNAPINLTLDYFIQGKPFYVEEYNPTIEEGVEAISQSGGIAVIAHPGLWFGKKHEPLLEKLIEKGLQGLEVYTPAHSQEQIRYFKRLAEDHNLISTHGSDFHGYRIKPSNILGNTSFLTNEG